MKQKDFRTIWQVPKYLPYIQPSLTEEIISNAEKKIGFKLPNEYIELLKIQNGGYIRFDLKDTPHRQIAGIGPYYPSITDFEWLNEYKDLSFDTKNLFPFDGDGHWNICLDYRRNKIDPEVTYIDTESDYEEHIAKTFNDYLNLLEINTDNKYVIETESTNDTIIKQISIITKIEFVGPDSHAHGYATYMSKYKDSWIWVSSNIAPTGFVRDNHERYNELKSQMKSTAIRFPEISESSLLISVSDENIRKELFTILEAEGIKIYSLKEYI